MNATLSNFAPVFQRLRSMIEEMTEETLSQLRVKQNVQFFLMIAAAVSAVLSAVFSAGIVYGPIAAIPAQFDKFKLDQEAANEKQRSEFFSKMGNIQSEIATLNETTKKTQWDLGSIGGNFSRLEGRQEAMLTDVQRLQNEVRDLGATVQQMLPREQFIEWKSKLELKTGIDTPSLSPRERPSKN